MNFLLIKSFKINKKFIICFLILLILSFSIILFVSFANDENEEKEDDYIKWVDFNVTSEVMNLTAKLDIDSHNKDSEIKYNWIELLSYLACKCGGNFDNFKHVSCEIDVVNEAKSLIRYLPTL